LGIFKPVAYTPHRGNKGFTELLADVPNVDIHDPVIAEILVAPHLLEQLLPAQNMTRILRQCQEQIELYSRQFCFLLVNPYPPRRWLDTMCSNTRPSATAVRIAAQRRRAAFTRATSSRGLNGLVT
jgi:hypothetical protein